MSIVALVLAEPPIRRIVQLAARLLPVSLYTKDHWSASVRPHYLAGVLYAAEQAKREGRDAIAVIEFGVAEGNGLVVLQAHAAAVPSRRRPGSSGCTWPTIGR
jgi:hypothetical protein